MRHDAHRGNVRNPLEDPRAALFSFFPEETSQFLGE